MEADEFRRRGKEMVDYIADYLENIASRKVYPDVSPGYLAPQMPNDAPQEPESWEEIMADVERLIMPGITHWHHPRFHAYFPASNSYPALCGEMLATGIGCIGFSWAASPAYTELEVVVLDWVGRLLQLPPTFLTSGGTGGGGVINGSASEVTLAALLAARNRAISAELAAHPELQRHEVAARLVGYHSDQAHSSAARAGLIAMLNLRPLQCDEKRSLRGATLKAAVKEDREAGRIPFFCLATLGTTNSCAFDDLDELGKMAEKEDIWLHVDAAYAGSSFICPEYQHYLKGVERALSFNFNPSKWFLTNFDCSLVWYREPQHLVDAFNVDPLYLRHDTENHGVPDFRHWQIPLGRKFRALKLWFVLRLYGVEGIRSYIRGHIQLAKRFEHLLLEDNRFEITEEVTMGLVCFRIKKRNRATKRLFECIKEDGRLHLVPGEFTHPRKVFFIRFAVCRRQANDDDIQVAFDVISELTTKILEGRKPEEEKEEEEEEEEES